MKKISLIGTISLASARVLMPYKTPLEDWVAFFRTDTAPSQVRVGVWRPVAGNRDGITGCCPRATRSAAQAKNPPAVECKLLITKHLIVKSGGVRKVQGIEAGERELPLNSLIGSDSQPEEKSRLTAEEKSWSLWRSTHSLIKFGLHCLAWQLATSHKEIISGTFD